MMQHDATLGSLKNAEQLRRRTPKMFGTYSLNYAEQLGRTEELKTCWVHVLVTSEETPDMFSHCFWGGLEHVQRSFLEATSRCKN